MSKTICAVAPALLLMVPVLARAAMDPAEAGDASALTQATMVTLNYRDCPLADVVASLSERSRMKLVLDTANRKAWQGVRVTLVEPEPVPFWKAIDRLAAAASLQYNFALTSPPGVPVLMLRLFHPGQPRTAPVVYQGPFRISVASAHLRNDRRLAKTPEGRGAPLEGPKLDVHVKIEAEPRMRIAQAGYQEVGEAVDDEGRLFVLPKFNGVRQPYDHWRKHLLTVPDLYVNLYGLDPSPEPAVAGRARTVKGKVRVVLESTERSALIMPTAGAKGKTFTQGADSAQVLDVQMAPNHRPVIDLALLASAETDADVLTQQYDYFVTSYWLGRQIRVFDAHKQPIAWVPGPPLTSPTGAKGTLRILPDDRAEPPAEVHAYRLVRTMIEIPFEVERGAAVERP